MSPLRWYWRCSIFIGGILMGIMLDLVTVNLWYTHVPRVMGEMLFILIPLVGAFLGGWGAQFRWHVPASVGIFVWMALIGVCCVVLPFVTMAALGFFFAAIHWYPNTMGMYLLTLGVPFTSFVIAVLLVACLIWRGVVQSIRAIDDAAQIAASGDINFDLPPSRVREIMQVNEALTRMGTGLREAIERQAIVEQERRVFISAIAHDLRTPLFAVRGYLEGMRVGIVSRPEEAYAYLAICQEEADELERRVASLFDYARLELLGQSMRYDSVPVTELFQSSLARFRPAIERRALHIAYQGEPETITATVDSHLLGRAFDNLLANAIRHTPDGGQIRVTWSLHENRWITFTIADSGSGLEPSLLAQVISALASGRPFQPQSDGAGLGLIIASRLLALHGGALHVANREPHGASITGSFRIHPDFVPAIGCEEQ